MRLDALPATLSVLVEVPPHLHEELPSSELGESRLVREGGKSELGAMDGRAGARFQTVDRAREGTNPYKFIDPDGRLSYQVSRPLNPAAGAAANHNFSVHHADRPGDPSGTVRSYGVTSDGYMGEVTSDTTGRNANTSAMDRAAWESIGGEGSQATFRIINADDAVVQDNANAVSSSFKYSPVPEILGGFNSNTAAGPVAQESDGGAPRVDNGKLQPGTSKERIDAARKNVLSKH